MVMILMNGGNGDIDADNDYSDDAIIICSDDSDDAVNICDDDSDDAIIL